MTPVSSASAARAAAPDRVKTVSILGSTGSVGCGTAEILAQHPDRFRAVALTANTNVDELARQARLLRPQMCAVADPARYGDLKAALSGLPVKAAAGREAVIEAAQTEADFVMAAIVGAAGLEPTLAAVERGAEIGFANKECLVSAGEVMVRAVARCGAVLLPVDSEHNAIFQVYDAENADSISRILLTASGGPFRTADIETMRAAAPADALKHPNWNMGAKITIDSATMMNKGLELIEARHLFPAAADNIEILIHPQSVIHSMVEYIDGSVLAQLGAPDMRTPIACALAWPKRVAAPAERLDFKTLGGLTFEAPDEARFPALRLAREALAAGAGAPCVMNAANEVAVAHFLRKSIGFLDIPAAVEETMGRLGAPVLDTLDDVLATDAAARRAADEICEARR